MTESSFVHLNLHSEFSVIDGMVRIKPLVKAAAEASMSAVALTDHQNMFAAVKFYRAATAANVKPIFGAEVAYYFPDQPDIHYVMQLLCKNDLGYGNLTRLVSRAYEEGQQLGKPLVSASWIRECADGLIALSGAMQGDVGQAILAGDDASAGSRARIWNKIFPDSYYLEVQRTGHANEEAYLQKAVEIAQQQDLPVVATNAVRFIAADDFEAHEARVAIHDGFTLEDPHRPKRYTAQQFLRSQEQMQEVFHDFPEALENSVEIAKRCNVHLKLGEVFLPQFPIPEGDTLETYFARRSQEGLDERLQLIFDVNSPEFVEQRKEYDERLQVELNVINDMGFPGYFLIVADFIQWAKNHGIPVGPGRGSGAGSLVAYALKITDLDPIPYNLLFERFLNPERVSMPDFDVDFCMDGRDRVIDYVAEHYGRESVSQIITFGTMAAKAVVRDVGRVLGHPYGYVDKVAKLIPFEIGMTLDKALQQEEQLAERYKEEEQLATLIDLAKKLEGLTRNVGKHAGGVVIAPSTLTDFVPVYCEQDSQQIVAQFDKDDVEAVGLVKFDFLGLRTLTIIDWTLQTVNRIRKQQGEQPIILEKLPMDDGPTFDLLRAATTTAVFQLESRGMKDLIKRLQPDCFEDIIALVALFRPGPLQSGMVDDFINRKHGRAKVVYPHPDLEPILSQTYGVILYQEQVMQIARVLANYTLGGADILRRAMGKKKPEEMAKQRTLFTEGAVAREVDGELAASIFDLMEKFAGYGFNKSHSAAYALLSYQTAWLKTHYPAAFMAAVLSSEMHNTDKVVIFIEECHSLRIKVLPPSVNSCEYQFTVDNEGNIVYGLGAVKGVGEAAIELMIENREKSGPFKDIFDLCQRVDLRKFNRRVLEALIKGGALDCLVPVTAEGEEDFDGRASLLATLDQAIKTAEQHLQNQSMGQFDLFGVADPDGSEHDNSLIDATTWSEQFRLVCEKETLGLYLTGHPFARYQEELGKLLKYKIADVKPAAKKTIKLAGMIIAMRTMMTKRGKRMAFATLDDRTGRIEIAIFDEVLNECRDLLTKDGIIVVEAEVGIDNYSGNMRATAQKVMSVEQTRQQFAKGLALQVAEQQCDQHFVAQLQQLLQPYTPGTVPVSLRYDSAKAGAVIQFSDEWRVRPSDELIEQLQNFLSAKQVKIAYS